MKGDRKSAVRPVATKSKTKTFNERSITSIAEGIDVVFSAWDFSNGKHGFLAARRHDRWHERAIPVVGAWKQIKAFLLEFPKEEFDQYFCPNTFRVPDRRAINAASTALVWADIDAADPAGFVPPPPVCWRTSPGRHQGLWPLDRTLHAPAAEGLSRKLAYRFGADRNGWGITKLLRVPGSLNHKPQYDRPIVDLVKCDWTPLPLRLFPRAPPAGAYSEESGLVDPTKFRAHDVVRRFRNQLSGTIRGLLQSSSAYGSDRSRLIFMIVAELHNVGASADEIAAVLQVNPYFTSKHGRNKRRLAEEIHRIRSKLSK